MAVKRVVALVGALVVVSAVASAEDVGYPAAGISQFWVGQANNSQRVDNPTGVAYYGILIYYTNEGRLNVEADAHDGGGCEGLPVPAHGSAFCQGCGVEEPGFGLYPFELVLVRASDGMLDMSGKEKLGVIANSSKFRAVPMPPAFFSMPPDPDDRSRLEACICRELVEDDRPPDQMKALGVICPESEAAG